MTIRVQANLIQQIRGDWDAALRYQNLAKRATSTRMRTHWIKCEVESVKTARAKEALLPPPCPTCPA